MARLFKYQYIQHARPEKDKIVFWCVATNILAADKLYNAYCDSDAGKQQNLGCYVSHIQKELYYDPQSD
jgi:hypothetical protein